MNNHLLHYMDTASIFILAVYGPICIALTIFYFWLRSPSGHRWIKKPRP
ncbi:MAG: hypothetical protein LBU08_01105 [Tannerellaceae bacterium]|nr:hypothetical protein [Tannerellaceae bacterium]